ncbi:MAG: rRNA maturation RNase YbeY [Pseudomonadota bacterium]
MNRVWVADEIGNAAALVRALRNTLLRSLRLLKIRDADVSLLLTSDRAIAAWNGTYRKIRRPTDVLSFPQGQAHRKRGRLLLGDIAISVPTARRQARREGVPLRDECGLLAVHGLLHLLGYDHAGPREAARMTRLQARLFPKVSRVL